MATPNNNIEIFNNQGEIFPSLSRNDVKTTDFDFYSADGGVFPYLFQPTAQSQSVPRRVKRTVIGK
jgi:hypothetical protein